MALIYLGLSQAYNSASRTDDGTPVPDADREVVPARLTTLNVPDGLTGMEAARELVNVVRVHTPDEAPTWYATDSKVLATAAVSAWPDLEQRDVATVLADAGVIADSTDTDQQEGEQ